MGLFGRRVAVPQQDFERATVASDIPICRHCGGLHSYRCPRILRVSYYDDAQQPDRIAAVEYDQEISRQLWPGVVWPEEVINGNTE